MSLLSHRRKIAANATEVGRSRTGAKPAGDFLLHFHHPQVSRGQVVIKRDTKVLEKPQSLFLIPGQPIEQILGLALFLAPMLALRGRRLSALLDRTACFQDLVLVPLELFDPFCPQSRLPLRLARPRPRACLRPTVLSSAGPRPAASARG